MQFATIEQANNYHADHPFALAWENDMEGEDKRRYLIYASRLLFDHLPWMPAYVARVQPNYPQALRDATVEFARRLFERGDPFAESDTAGIKQFKAGPIDAVFETSSGDTPVIPNEVLSMLSSIAPVTVANGINVPLVRY